jgi:hypothetical protein
MQRKKFFNSIKQKVFISYDILFPLTPVIQNSMQRKKLLNSITQKSFISYDFLFQFTSVLSMSPVFEERKNFSGCSNIFVLRVLIAGDHSRRLAVSVLQVQFKHTYIALTLYPLRGSKVEVSQIFLRDTHVLPKLVSNEEHCRRDRW